MGEIIRNAMFHIKFAGDWSDIYKGVLETIRAVKEIDVAQKQWYSNSC